MVSQHEPGKVYAHFRSHAVKHVKESKIIYSSERGNINQGGEMDTLA